MPGSMGGGFGGDHVGGGGAGAAGGSPGGPNGGGRGPEDRRPASQANTNYYKAAPGYKVVFRKGEATQVPTGPGGTTLIKQGPK